MSKTIDSFGISNLLVGAHYEFHRSTNAAIVETTPEALMLTELAPRYATELATLFQFVNRAQGSVLSKKIEETDRERDVLLSEIFAIINNAAKSPIAARSQPGLLLQRIIAPYRGIQGNEKNKETAQIRGLLRDLGATEENIDAQDALAIAPLIQEVKKLNNRMADYLEERGVESGTRAATLKGDTDQQRKVVDGIYRAIVNRINAVAELQTTPAVDAFIDAQNGRVIEYKNVLTHMRAGGTGNEKGTGDKPTPETPEEPGEL